MAMQSPVNKIPYLEDRVLEFQGWNRRVSKEQGEMADMQNLTSDKYPSLYQRKGRSIREISPFKVIYDAISRQDHSDDRKQKLFTLGTDSVSQVGAAEFARDGEILRLPSGMINLDRYQRMTAINTKICFFPRKMYYDTKANKFGYIGGSYYAHNGTVDLMNGEVQLIINFGQEDVTEKFKVGDVVEIRGFFWSDGITQEPEIYVYYGDETDEAYQQRDTSKNWKLLPAEYGKITFLRCFYNKLTDAWVTEIRVNDSLPAFSEVHHAPGYEGSTYASLNMKNVSLDRRCPDLDYVIEWNNRLWGCSNKTNTIYASKLGDPTNWEYYQQTSMDSYYAEQGSDGNFTGAAAYSNHLIFFKEDCMIKIYGTAPSNFQITTTHCYGVEEGSSQSICIVDDMVFYKSRLGIMCYQGEQPECISRKLGDLKFNNVVAGTDGYKYYATIHDIKADEDYMIVCDTENALWHREDNAAASKMVWHKGELLMCDALSQTLLALNDDESDEDIKWYAEFGPFDEDVENKKITNRIDMRFNLEERAVMQVYIMLDESGDWELLDTFSGDVGLVAHSVFLPRRCNRFSIKLVGEGYCRVDSLRRQFREGSQN